MHRTRMVIAALALAAGMMSGAGPAEASHWAPRLPVSVVPCPYESVTYPSCVRDLNLVSGSGTSAIDIDTTIEFTCETVDTCQFVIETCTETLPGVEEYCSVTKTPGGS